MSRLLSIIVGCVFIAACQSESASPPTYYERGDISVTLRLSDSCEEFVPLILVDGGILSWQSRVIPRTIRVERGRHEFGVDKGIVWRWRKTIDVVADTTLIVDCPKK